MVPIRSAADVPINVKALKELRILYFFAGCSVHWRLVWPEHPSQGPGVHVRHRLSSIVVSLVVLAGALAWSHGVGGPIAVASVQQVSTSDASSRFVAADPLKDYTFVAPTGTAKQPV